MTSTFTFYSVAYLFLWGKRQFNLYLRLRIRVIYLYPYMETVYLKVSIKK